MVSANERRHCYVMPPHMDWAHTKNDPAYRQTSNISCIVVGNKIVDHSVVVVAWPVGAAPTTSSFLT